MWWPTPKPSLETYLQEQTDQTKAREETDNERKKSWWDSKRLSSKGRREQRGWMQEMEVEGHNGWRKQKEDKKKGELSWFLVTQRATEGLTGTNSLWCNANSISGWAVMRCKWKRPEQRSRHNSVRAGSNPLFSHNSSGKLSDLTVWMNRVE